MWLLYKNIANMLYFGLNRNPTLDNATSRLEYQFNNIRRSWIQARFNVFSGILQQSTASLRPYEVAGWLYRISGDHPDEPAMPHKCPRCDADYRRGRRIPTPLRNHRTGFQKACQVIASALCRGNARNAKQPIYNGNWLYFRTAAKTQPNWQQVWNAITSEI